MGTKGICDENQLCNTTGSPVSCPVVNEGAWPCLDKTCQFIVDVPGYDRSPLHVLPLPEGKALVTEAFGEPNVFQVSWSNSPLSVQPYSSGFMQQQLKLLGPLVLSTDFLGNSAVAIGMASAEGAPGPGKVITDVSKAVCLSGITITHTARDATIEADQGPALAKLEPPGDPYLPPEILPWGPVVLRSSRPLLPTLDGLTFQDADGKVLPSVWSSSPTEGYTTRARGDFEVWSGLAGKTITLSGSLTTSSGVASPVAPLSVKMFDFGVARTAPLSFTSGAVADLSSWGQPVQLPPGEPCEEANGCLSLSTGSGIAGRFSGQGITGLRVRLRLPNPAGAPVLPKDTQVHLRVAARDDYPGKIPLPNSDTMIDRVVSLPKPTDEIFFVLSVPRASSNAQTDPSCNDLYPLTAYIESVSPILP